MFNATFQQATCGHRGRSGDPLYGIRRTLRTGAGLLTARQFDRLNSVFAADDHAAVNATWGIYQRIVEAYRNPDRAAAKQQRAAVIKDLAGDVPPSLTEVITLGRTLKRQVGDVLAYFDRPGTSNGPTEAIYRSPRSPSRHRAGFPQPQPLRHPIPARHRRIQTSATPSNAMSQ